MIPLKELEKLEHYYLMKFYYFLMFVRDDMLNGFMTKEKIKEDWIGKWDPEEIGKGISSFSTGAERIVYALFNNQAFWRPNSAPIGSDLFFETEDAFIHIDLKTVQIRNIGDYATNIFVGDNQNSYDSEIKQSSGKSFDPPREYEPALPHMYKSKSKPCLTYFITILYDEKDLKILNINLLSMPNGALKKIYGPDVLKAGKNPGKIRFNFSKVGEFKLLDKNPKRIKVIYFSNIIEPKIFKKLNYIYSIYQKQI